MLTVHRSERSDVLTDGLARLLRDAPDDPFATEVVAVPAQGVERWITQRLSHVLGAAPEGEDGVCAAVMFPSPARLMAAALAAGSGVRPEDDPWQVDRLAWAVLETVDECVTEPWCSTLAGHLGAARDRGRRLTVASRLARLYDSYGAHRPAMVEDWARGRDTDGLGEPLDSDLTWQAELWRRLRRRVGEPSPAERLGPACERIRTRPESVDLPERLSLFGPTRLTAQQLAVLAALAVGRDVHLWVPHPSPVLWTALAADDVPGPRRGADSSALRVRNPLLASLGRDSRELQLRLLAVPGPVSDLHLPAPTGAATLLGRLQEAIAGDMPFEPAALDDTDRSVQVHACHGPARQVEVLREVLVGLLADDPTLEPRDVLVMCPDIEEYAPLISATFGLATDDAEDQHPGSRLRVRLADRSLRQTNPLLGVLSALLELADSRVTATQLLDLASTAPVRRRFGFDDEELERVQGWVSAAGVRWGLDARHRARFRMDGVAQNTWRAGLDRLLLGVAMADEESRWLGLALPLDDVDSSDVDLAGRLAELVDRVEQALDAMSGERSLDVWVESLESALDSLGDVGERDAWQWAQARAELARVRSDAGARADRVLLTLADVRALLADRLKGRPTRANFRTGTLTMCSMVPMRSVPHRVVCLLGLDDGRFPRTTVVDGDDVLARDPCIGERDPRSEDRQLLLDAILAAREHLVVLYTGADPRTNARRPPAVPIGEILDAVDASVVPVDGRTGRNRVLVVHPLQPFDARNFLPDALGRPEPFSFDQHALGGARRALRPRERPAAFLDEPLPAPPDGDVGLDDLVRFVEKPARGFVGQRLGITLLREEEELSDALDVSLTGLQSWEVGERLLQARLDGVDAETAEQAEWRRGGVPPGALGQRLLGELRTAVEPLVAVGAELRTGPARSVDVHVALDGGTTLTGTVDEVYGATVVRVGYSRLGARQRLRAWVLLLTLAAAMPEVAWTAVVVGRARGGVALSRIGPLEPGSALRLLEDVVRLRRAGLCEPLPMAVRTSFAYAGARRSGLSGRNALERARLEWDGSDRMPGEREEDVHRLVWGSDAPLEVLLGGSGAGSDGTTRDAAEPTRFGSLARALWEPLLDVETGDVR